MSKSKTDDNAIPNSETACPQARADCTIGETLRELKQQMARLQESATRDALTGVYNRRHFDWAIEQELERTQRSHEPTSLLLIDVDFFKKINDNYGHQRGDEVLVDIAGRILDSVRKLDVVCRYGGEEFAVILPSTTPMTSRIVAERIRLAIATNPFDGEPQLSVTVSVGIAGALHTPSATLEPALSQEFFEHADKALYRAKKNGRNCVELDFEDTHAKSRVSDEEKDALWQTHQGDEDETG